MNVPTLITIDNETHQVLGNIGSSVYSGQETAVVPGVNHELVVVVVVLVGAGAVVEMKIGK